MRADQVEAAWRILMPVLDVWKAIPPSDFPNYASGTWGPDAAQGLLTHPGHRWPLPVELHSGADSRLMPPGDRAESPRP